MSGIINEDRLRELIDGRVKAMREPYPYHFWEKLETLSNCATSAAIFMLVLAVVVPLYSRLDRLESIVATDREFSHGVVADGPAVPIHPRAATEPLPAPVEVP